MIEITIIERSEFKKMLDEMQPEIIFCNVLGSPL